MSERAAYWQRLLGEWEQSGLSQAEFCRRRGLRAVNLAWWKRRLRGSPGRPRGGRQRVTRSAGHAAFVELALPSHPVRGGLGYELVLPSGVGLRLPADFDPERVARLVQALGTAAGGQACGAGRVAAC
jgi:hypothetical protein